MKPLELMPNSEPTKVKIIPVRAAVPLLCAILLLGCGTPRNQSPSWHGATNKSMNAVSGCLVAALNRELRDGSLTHSIQTIEPDKVVEIAPQYGPNLWSETYFVRVTARGPGQSMIEVFAAPEVQWKHRLSTAAASCQ